MNKAHFLFAIAAISLLGCTSDKHNTQLGAAGKINHISVIIDDALWNGEVGDSIRNKFASPVLGLPQEEPLFTINQYPLKLLEGFSTSARNILIIKAGKRDFKIATARKQNLIYFSGRNVAEILEILEVNAGKTIELIKATELTESIRLIDTSLIEEPHLLSRFAISLHIPSTFKVALEADRFLWLKREIISGSISILVYEIPQSSIGTDNPAGDIIRIRDSIGALYIRGNVPDSPMITEQAYMPYLRRVKIAEIPAIEARGTWELRNDFMSGPFLLYAVGDTRNSRILILEGFCYAPSKEKRDLIHELEAIFKSIKLQAWNQNGK
jgi:hypothetical protein